MRTLSNKEFLEGIHSVVEVLSALQLAMQRGQLLTELQKMEVISTLDLSVCQVEDLKKVLND